MTDLCPVTGKTQLSASQAQRQAKNSNRTFRPRHCDHCGHWHVNSIGVLQRQQVRDQAKMRERRNEPIPDVDDTDD